MTSNTDDFKPDPDFAEAKPVAGLEHLGKAIVDANGVPSGSPANYEALRGATGESLLTDADKAKILADLQSEFGLPSKKK